MQSALDIVLIKNGQQKRKMKVSKLEFVKHKTLHDMLVNQIFQYLINENRSKRVSYEVSRLINNASKEQGFRKKIILTTGESIYPDIVDTSRYFVYEIHIKGERRREYFDKLPDSWKGINVFYEENDNPQTLVAKFVTNDVQIIKWYGNEKFDDFETAIKPHVQFLKDKIKHNGGKMTIPVSDLLKIFGMTEQTSIYGIKSSLFFEGIVLSNGMVRLQGTEYDVNVFTMRERVESDKLD